MPKAIDFREKWGTACVPLEICKEMTLVKKKFDIFLKDVWPDIPVALKKGGIIIRMECDEFGKLMPQENKTCDLMF